MLGRRVVVGISGGVDSSVAALLLKRAKQFERVEGVFMRNWEPGDESGDSYTCPAARDFADAQRVCEEIGIPLHRADFVKEYWNNVFEPYLERFKGGGTPNPDVFCNKEIKFKCFKAFVHDAFGPETHLATGHYARVSQRLDDPAAPPRLLRGLDPDKDQSYFLCAVPGEALRNVHFPVGELRKSRVREIAQEAGLSTATKKDSVGICFIGKRRFSDFISDYIVNEPGRFVDLSGRDLGPHDGVHAYTLGQRANIGGAASKMFVAAKDVESGTITVVAGADNPALLSSALRVQGAQMFWVAGSPPYHLLDGERKFHCLCRVRYRQPMVACTVTVPEGADGFVHVVFDHPQVAVTPQQIAAFFVGDECLGGGIIDSSEPVELHAGPSESEKRYALA